MIAQYEPGAGTAITEAYIHADGHGSTRLLTDPDVTLSTTLLYSGEHTARILSDFGGETIDAVAAQTTANAIDLFGLDIAGE